jgi:hypothetical protein
MLKLKSNDEKNKANSSTATKITIKTTPKMISGSLLIDDGWLDCLAGI